jgi:hypothetical protein
MDLFTPVVAPEKLHYNFKMTLKPNAVGVREVISTWADGFVDRDGKFVEEFQTTYNSSFWELYLFAVLKHLGIKVDFSFEAPDFVPIDHRFVIEAAIASHAMGDVPEWEKTIEGIVDPDIETAQLQSIIRLSNGLIGKSEAYKQRYAALPHVVDRAYIVAIANYGRQDFNLLGDVAMQHLLYDPLDLKQITKANGANVPIGLFNSDQYAHISAVLFSSVATFGKTRAFGKHEGQFVFNALRIRNNFEPIQVVAVNTEYKESLTDGLRLFTNPFAKVPIDLNLFDDIGIRRHVANTDGTYVVSCHPDGDLCMRIVHAIFQRPAAKFFRTVRHTYNKSGQLAERAILSGRHESYENAATSIAAATKKSPPTGFDKASTRWCITDKNGRKHWLMIEAGIG